MKFIWEILNIHDINKIITVTNRPYSRWTTCAMFANLTTIYLIVNLTLDNLCIKVVATWNP